MKKLIIVFAFTLLAGCASAPLTNQIEAASAALEDTVNQINHLQKIGQLSVPQESALLDRASALNTQLRLVKGLAISCQSTGNCSEAKGQLAAANALLLQLQSEVSK